MSSNKNAAPNGDSDSRGPNKSILIAVSIVAVGFVIAWQFVGAPPPKRLVLATGPAGGGYAQAGTVIRDALAESGIEVELRESPGSIRNLEWLRDGEIDLAMVQSGLSIDGSTPEAIGSVYYEPLWIFVRDNVEADTLGDLGGQTIEVGAPGSGTRSVAIELLEANGVGIGDFLLGGSTPDVAIEGLLQGRVEVMFLIASPSSPRVLQLLEADGVKQFPLARAHAISRHFRSLTALDLTPGLVDLERRQPTANVPIVAAAACLVGHEDLHPAIPPLLIEALEADYGRGGLFEDPDEFPSEHAVTLPIAKSAATYYARGPSFLYRVLPFQLAAGIDRLKILLLPLLTLLIPLLKAFPPVYRWRIRSRILRWYKELLQVEADLRDENSPTTQKKAVDELDRLEDEIAEVRVPLGYAEELYNARMHIRLVREKLESA